MTSATFVGDARRQAIRRLVRHHEDRPGAIREGRLETFDARQVDVIRRRVHDERPNLRRQRFGEHELPRFAGGKILGPRSQRTVRLAPEGGEDREHALARAGLEPIARDGTPPPRVRRLRS
jgi:hypothetical protein